MIAPAVGCSPGVMVLRKQTLTSLLRKKILYRTPKLLPPGDVLNFHFNRNPDLSPDLTRDRSGAFPTDLFSRYVYTYLGSLNTRSPGIFRNFVHPFISRDYARGDLGGPAPRSPGDDWEEEDFDRPETPPARMPSLPPGHEDENGLEYADVEDVIDTRSDLTKLPGDAAHRSDESIFNRSGVDFRIASDTGLLFPPSEGEFARISRDLRRESMGPTTATTSQPPVGFPYPHHPLAQSYVPSSSPPPTPQQEPQHLVPPLPVPRTPSPPSNFLSGKRKRVATPERGAEGSNAGKAVHPIRSAFRQVATRHNKVIEPPRKRQRLLTHRSTWDFPGFTNTGRAPAQPRVDSPTCGNSPEPSSWPAAAPQVQGEDSELEDSELEGSELDKSEVIEMLSRDVDQGESESEESTGNILEGLGEPRPSLPALTADNTQSATPNEAQSEVHTPTVALMPPKVPPSDVFGPIVLSARANKISDRLSIDVPKDTGGSAVLAGSERGSGNISSKSSKSARFSLDGRIEKEDHKVFRKTPVRPRASSSMWIKEAELALSAEAQAESEDVAKPLSPPKKKRAIGARVRRPRPAAPGEIGPTVNHEDDLPSIPDNQTPQKPRRGESVSVQPIPKTPVRKSSRSRK